MPLSCFEEGGRSRLRTRVSARSFLNRFCFTIRRTLTFRSFLAAIALICYIFISKDCSESGSSSNRWRKNWTRKQVCLFGNEVIWYGWILGRKQIAHVICFLPKFVFPSRMDIPVDVSLPCMLNCSVR